jgi:hypothetical protein
MFQNIIAVDLNSKKVRFLITDIIIVASIYFLPAFSHLTSVPFYLFEPMRIAMVFSIIVTNQKNSILIALTLPAISLILSSHPNFIKSILIMTELTINVILFYKFSKNFNNIFVVMFFTILIAKMFYYSSKFLFIKLEFLQGDLVSTPIWIQFLVLIFLSIITAFTLKNK